MGSSGRKSPTFSSHKAFLMKHTAFCTGLQLPAGSRSQNYAIRAYLKKLPRNPSESRNHILHRAYSRISADALSLHTITATTIFTSQVPTETLHTQNTRVWSVKLLFPGDRQEKYSHLPSGKAQRGGITSISLWLYANCVICLFTEDLLHS